MRENTEHPITVWEGTNKLIGVNEIEYEIEEILKGNGKKGKVPHLWDGNAAGRMVNILESWNEKSSKLKAKKGQRTPQ